MQMPTVKTEYFPLKGGLNLVTPPLSMPDGSCRDAVNFDCDTDGGYRRVAGYERYDGRTQPSTVTYATIPVSSFSGAVVKGNVINGQSSGATATVLAVTANSIVVANVTGNFASGGETIRIVTTAVATSIAGQSTGGAPSPKLDATYTNLAADVFRALIGVVPGSGSVLGVWLYKNDVYAFRNNAGATAAVMYKATTSGWQAVSLNNQVPFTNANTLVGASDTLTQGGVTATVLRVVVESGTLVSGVNTGKLIIGAPAGGNFAAGAATSTGSGTLTLSGVQTAITLSPGGKYEFVNHNFGGSSGTFRMYGTSGTNKAFEFDGTVYVPLTTGLPTDTPSHIAVHLNYLMVSFDSSVIRSSIGSPYMWQGITGATEFAAGEEVTQIIPVVGSENSAALAVFTTNKTLVLYGSVEADLRLVTFSFEAGGFPNTAQNIGDVYVLDQLGVRQLSSSQNFGNFDDSQISRIIRPWMTPRVGKAIGSLISRQRSQYRLYFNDGYALHITFDNGRIIGMMLIRTEHTFYTTCSQETNSGEEFLLAGGTDGYVYRLEKGTSFDGAIIESSLSLAFSHMRGPRVRKTYKKAVYEITGGGYNELNVSYELGYANSDVNQGQTSVLSASFGSVFWDSFIWDAFFWDGKSLLPLEQKLYGTGENISLLIRCSSDEFQAFTINSAILQYIPRRLMR